MLCPTLGKSAQPGIWPEIREEGWMHRGSPPLKLNVSRLQIFSVLCPGIESVVLS